MSKRSNLTIPTPEEDATIAAGIAADSDTYELTDEEFAQLERSPGRSEAFTSIRLDADVLEAFLAGGKGWQTRINEALREWLATHTVR